MVVEFSNESIYIGRWWSNTCVYLKRCFV